MTTIRRALVTVVSACLCLGCGAATPASVAPSVMTVSPSAAPSASGMSVTYSSNPAASSPPGAIAVQMGPGPIFRPKTLQAATGDISIFLTYPAVPPDMQGATHGHNLALRGLGSLDIIARSDYQKSGGDPVVLTVAGLAPGAYTFVCEFPGHASSGMTGTLTVGP